MEPYIFKDGRKGKYWIADTYNLDLDGPFDSREDAQPTLDKLTGEHHEDIHQE